MISCIIYCIIFLYVFFESIYNIFIRTFKKYNIILTN